MADPTGLTEAEMVEKSQGIDVLSLSRVQELARAAKNVKSWRIKSFLNKRDGWLLCRVARGHKIVRVKRTYCGLCGHNIAGAMRPMTTAMCSLCATPLCTVPREGETGLCCYLLWHGKDVLAPRIYKRGEHAAATDPEPAPAEPLPSEPSPAVAAHRRRNEEEAQRNAEFEAASKEAVPIIAEWAPYGDETDVRVLLHNLHLVLPTSSTFRVSESIFDSSDDEVRKAYRRALIHVHPDKVVQRSPTALEHALSCAAFPILHKFCVVKQTLARIIRERQDPMWVRSDTLMLPV